MYLIRKTWFFLIVLLVTLVLTGIALYAYLTMTAMTRDTLPLVKYRAESLLFYSLLLTILTILLFIMLAFRSRHILKELDKVIELSKYSNYDTQEYLKKIGPLGLKMNELFSQLQKLNRMKSLKISSLSEISRFILEHTDMFLLLCDIQGQVIQVSTKLVKKWETDRDLLVGKLLTQFLVSLDFNHLKEKLEAGKTFFTSQQMSLKVQEKESVQDMLFYPIFNTEGDLSHIICILEGGSLLADLKTRIPKMVPKRLNIFGVLSHIFQGNRNKG